MKNDIALTQHLFYEAAKKGAQAEVSCFSNGHSGYMVVNVPKDKFADWATLFNLSNNEEISALKFTEGKNGIIVASFDTFEKFPKLSRKLIEAFPEAVVYAYGLWDISSAEVNDEEIKAPDSSLYSAVLYDCFADDGNLRIDIKITDKASGCSFSIGDLVCFSCARDVADRQDNTNFAYLYGLLRGDDVIAVDAAVSKCTEQLLQKQMP